MLEYKEKLIKTKAEYGELIKKGLYIIYKYTYILNSDNFLTELELGNAPPQEYIIKNLEIDYDKYSKFLHSIYFFFLIKLKKRN